ncbi:translocation and assembly module lipoprotein TamL [Flavobacterium difficile]|uniref:BamA/TamA family outer membrane protein n=1 Tax=Flavobacterium difficile TaxID=2709659 RepID=A0ABX0I0I6_9FLAO|nr:BamA/TamA family outer membrane protein [Flavobacterium difficile]
MKKFTSKIVLFFLFGLFFYSCSEVRKLQKKQLLIHNNEIIVNGKSTKAEDLQNQLYQKPNSKLLGFKPRLQLFNLSKKNADSSYQAWLLKKPNRVAKMTKLYSKKQVNRLGKSFLVSGYSDFFKRVGEAPSILDTSRVKKSEKRLFKYHFNRGFFDAKVTSKIDSLKKQKVKISYLINSGKPYLIDSIFRNINSPIIDSLYVEISNRSLIKSGTSYNAENIAIEKKRITTEFRNRGVYHFQENYIKQPDADTIDKPKNTLNLTFNIGNRIVKKGDSSYTEPFKLYKINKVNIFTDKQVKEKVVGIDSIAYKNYNFYSSGKLKYKPKAITNSIFIEEGKLFSDQDKTLTTRALSNLKIFSYPQIQYVEDASGEGLIANVVLTPLKKYQFNIKGDLTHSNIQQFGISGFTGITFRNIFKGAEILDFSIRGNLGTSTDPSIKNSTNAFFNILEYGGDLKLTFPRIFFPINTKSIIKKESLPSTSITLGLSKQTNIGLDKENYNGSFYYDWGLNKDETKKFRFDLFNLQFVRNLNIGNYFNVYNYSYDTLNDLALVYNTNPNFNVGQILGNDLTFPGAVEFINQVGAGFIDVGSEENFKTINTIGERRKRLIENNLILSSSFSYNLSTKSDFNDVQFYNIKAKIESSGNILNAIAKQKNEGFSDNNKRTLFGVEYAQYIKTELEYIKHLHLYKKSSLAFRFFGGIAIPYGNSNSVPFSRSYFAGGSNDNRGWQAYSLGPGSSASVNDFNEANLKFSLNLEYRFNIFNSLNGALFADAGNIWNVFDNVEDEKLKFKGAKSFEEFALGTGFGLRYDFGFFVVRGDFGFKAYNPAKRYEERWLKDVNLSKTVFNIGINYPF